MVISLIFVVLLTSTSFAERKIYSGMGGGELRLKTDRGYYVVPKREYRGYCNNYYGRCGAYNPYGYPQNDINLNDIDIEIIIIEKEHNAR